MDTRTRFVGLGEVTLIVILPLVAVAVVSAQSNTIVYALTPVQKLVVNSAMFTALTLTGLMLLTSNQSIRPTSIGRLTASAVLGWVAFFCIVVSAGRRSVAFSPAAFGIFIAAAAEELVFRVVLPTAIGTSAILAAWKNRAVIGVIVAQVVFALSHAIPTDPYSSSTPISVEMCRLIVAGLMYAILLRVGGLWLSIGVHASLNIEQFFVAIPVQVSVWMIAVVGLVCMPFVRLNVNRAFPNRV